MKGKTILGVLAFFAVVCGVSSPLFAQDNGLAYRAQGVASYGPNINGIPTESGEQYRADDFTAAHRDLAMNTLVLVTNMDNGRQAVVRVNDRGPHNADYLIEVSYAAAKKLGMIDAGTADVVLTQVNDDGSKLSLDFNKTDHAPVNVKAPRSAPVIAAAPTVVAAPTVAAADTPAPAKESAQKDTAAKPAPTSAKTEASKETAPPPAKTETTPTAPDAKKTSLSDKPVVSAAPGVPITTSPAASLPSTTTPATQTTPATTSPAPATTTPRKQTSPAPAQSEPAPSQSTSAPSRRAPAPAATVPDFAQNVPFNERPGVPTTAYNPIAQNAAPVVPPLPVITPKPAPDATLDVGAARSSSPSANAATPRNADTPTVDAPLTPAPVKPVESVSRPPESTLLWSLPADAEIAAKDNTLLEPVKPVAKYPSATVLGDPIVSGRTYRIQVGSFRVTRNAVDVFDRLRDAGFEPAYERKDDYYRIVIPGIKGENIVAAAKTLGAAGFAEVIAKQE